jgi:hypothetical protein
MRARSVVVLAVLVSMGLLLWTAGAGTSFASSAPGFHLHPVAIQEPAPNQHETPIQSVNGKVAAISKTNLTLEVVADGKTDPVDFIIDQNTKTDGDIKPGIMATVDYHTKDGKKYAAHIMPAEAKKP